MARRRRFSAEFKRRAFRRAAEPRMTDALVCEELGVSTRQLRRWKDAVKEHGEKEAFPALRCSCAPCPAWPCTEVRPNPVIAA